MANQSQTTGLPEFFADTKSADSVRRQFIEAPMQAAGQAALGSALELANLMSLLPDAFAASQQRELDRVTKSGNKNDPRVAALQTSIEQADVLRTMARRGQARVQRVLVALSDNNDVFHGFVSDAQFAPLKGLTVRLTDSTSTRAGTLSATTDDDGYFSIALGTKSGTPPAPGAKAGPVNLSQRITEILAGFSQEPGAAPAAGAAAVTSQVEILKKGKLLYSDPILVAREGGSIYREYVIADTEPSSASDFRDFVSKRAFSSPGSQVDPTESAVGGLRSDNEVPLSSATSATLPRTKKGSPRGAKSTKRASKK